MLISTLGEIRVILNAKEFVIICVICVEINLYKHYELATFHQIPVTLKFSTIF